THTPGRVRSIVPDSASAFGAAAAGRETTGFETYVGNGTATGSPRDPFSVPDALTAPTIQTSGSTSRTRSRAAYRYSPATMRDDIRGAASRAVRTNRRRRISAARIASVRRCTTYAARAIPAPSSNHHDVCRTAADTARPIVR